MIKFRTWYPKGKKMSTPDKYAGDVFIRQNGEKVICIDTGEWEDGYQVDFMKDNLDLVEMLSTGLVDKNGKEIYEGDIVQADKQRAVIEWHRDIRTALVARHLSNELGFGDYNYDWINEFGWEVIGNIYEDKNLLK